MAAGAAGIALAPGGAAANIGDIGDIDVRLERPEASDRSKRGVSRPGPIVPPRAAVSEWRCDQSHQCYLEKSGIAQAKRFGKLKIFSENPRNKNNS